MDRMELRILCERVWNLNALIEPVTVTTREATNNRK